MLKTLLCVDIGTTSLKAGLFTAGGEAVFLYRKSFMEPDSRFAANQWMAALAHCIKKIGLTDYEICAVCVSGAGPTVVLQNGLTVRWNEVLPEKLEIPEELKGSLFIPKILTAKKLFSDDFEKSDFIFSGPEFFIYQITGTAVTILPEKRFEAAYWKKGDGALLGFDEEKLPSFKSTGQLAGHLTPVAASALGLKAGIPVFCGGPDFVVALIGTNTLLPGRVCDRAGSSEGFNFCTDTAFFTPKTRTLPSVIPGLWNISVLSEESGRIFVEYKHRLEKEKGFVLDYPALVKEALSNPQSEGGKIVSRILEQVRASVGLLKAALAERGIELPVEMAVTGGQAKNDLWMQRKADSLAMTLEICNCADSELTGDACAGWYGLGLYSSIQDAADYMVKVTKRFFPKNENI